MGSICLNRLHIVAKKRLNRPNMFLVNWESLYGLNIRCKKETQWAQYVSIGPISLHQRDSMGSISMPKRDSTGSICFLWMESVSIGSISLPKRDSMSQYVSIGPISLQKRHSIGSICFLWIGRVSIGATFVATKRLGLNIRCKKETQ